jgi:hypothetical protein
MAPGKLPIPPMMITMKRSLRTFASIPSPKLAKGVARTPLRPAKPHPKAKMKVRHLGILIPKLLDISGSSFIERITIPAFVLYKRNQIPTATARAAATMTRL